MNDPASIAVVILLVLGKLFHELGGEKRPERHRHDIVFYLLLNERATSVGDSAATRGYLPVKAKAPMAMAVLMEMQTAVRESITSYTSPLP